MSTTSFSVCTHRNTHIRTELTEDLSPDARATAELIALHKTLIMLIRYMKRTFSH